MDDQRTEACGRCSMTSVVSMTEGDAPDERPGRDPFDGDRIEVSESELRLANRHVLWLGRLKRRLDEVATRLTYGR
ncbi:hypothetical protein M0R88_06425 [Halorussus gelatinilyticus]|uniref:Uncharacterized protein n=1 Tax=Halorussus gelatinilyticus TaxID=2937524 RepID=A0A8U0IKU8_9EURY|nr:hypothetical protein [Halorussus gelatinilyticus]UPW01733.1 hypothetical protein M0R88_06425 [Halorussus gelatinilyticus]